MLNKRNFLLATAFIASLFQGNVNCRKIHRANSCTARPFEENLRNVITVPPNCTPGQELVNGICREVWRAATVAPYNGISDLRNVITVPPNCPPGQKLVNGVCRDIWRAAPAEPYNAINEIRNVITVPPNCPAGQELVNGICRDVWRAATAAPFNDINGIRNVITVPPNCPTGQELINGICRDVWRSAIAAPFLGESAEELKNVIVAPPNCRPGQVLVNQRCYDLWSIVHGSRNTIVAPSNCPPGQQLVNGRCRDVWRSSNVMDTFFEKWRNMLSRSKIQFGNQGRLLPKNDFVKDKNVINVPIQCPAGYRPDALGICRPYLVPAEKLRNVIVAPPNCRPGQVLVNQRCYDLWSIGHGSRNIIVAPSNCPPGQQLVNGRCRDVWRSSNLQGLQSKENLIQIEDSQFHNKDPLLADNDFENRNVINVPHQCPVGYRADALGNCRRVLQ